MCIRLPTPCRRSKTLLTTRGELRGFFGGIPIRQRFSAAQNFGGPAPEIYRQCDAVPAETAQDHRVAAPEMPHEHWPPSVRDQNRTTPAVHKLHILKSRMQTAHANFE